MTCQECHQATKNPLSGIFRSGCKDCEARMLASSQVFYWAVESNTLTPDYRDALQRIFGDKWQDGHKAVKRWHKLIQPTNGQKTKGFP